MSIISFDEVERGGNIDSSFSQDVTRKYLVKCDSASDIESDIYQHPACPVLGKPAPFSPFLFTKDLSAQWKKNSRWIWYVDATFSTERTQAQTLHEDPTKNPAKVRVTTRLEDVEKAVDVNGRLRLNTAGSLIKKKYQIPRVQIHVSKDIGPLQGWIQDISGVVNSAPVRFKGKSYDTGTLKLVSADIGETDYSGRYAFDHCELVFEHRAEGWDALELNIGYYELIDDPAGRVDKKGKPLKVQVRCENNQGEPETEPCFLDKDGRRIQEDVTTTVGLSVKVYKAKLEPKDIILLNFKDLVYFDFNKLPIT